MNLDWKKKMKKEMKKEKGEERDKVIFQASDNNAVNFRKRH